MKRQKKLAAAVASFGAATMCLVGGTFAWYVVSNTGTATVNGTTVSGGALQIGIKSSQADLITNDVLNGNDFVYDATNGCYWPKTSTNLDAATIAKIFTREGYSNDSGRIDLLTSGSYQDGDEIKIKPESKVTDVQDYTTAVFNNQVITADPSKSGENHTDVSDKNVYANEEGGRYISFELVFRTYDAENSTGDKNCPIYLSDSTFLTTTGDPTYNLHKSVRVGLESDVQKSIFSPSQYATYSMDADKIKEINVGGVLDKEPADGVNDHYSVASTKTVNTQTVNNFTHYEYWFGEYETLNDDESTDNIDESVFENNYVEFTGADASNSCIPDYSANGSTFNPFEGKHLWVGKSGSAYENDVLKVFNSRVVAKKQVSHGLDYYVYHTGAAAADNHPIANTGSTGLTTLKVTIWAEGWDPACTNDAAGSFVFNAVFYAPTLKNF
ncbi:MAG: hypothetical protein HUJ61_07385 [Bacilli bacterium]|nr:hypothetical protein [Bacilli bacterium]